MTDNNKDLCAGHRERLRQNFLDDKLAKYELLELLLSYAIPRKDVRPMARMLWKKFGGMYPILSASPADLMTVAGVGKNIATFIKVVQKIMLEGYKCEMENQNVILHTREQLDNYMLLMLGGKDVEESHVLYLDSDGRLQEDELHSNGDVDYTEIRIRQIVQKALALKSRFIVLVHNHPKPNCTFSQEDSDLTKKLKEALAFIQIILYDHYVVSGGIVYSMKEMMLL